QVEVVDPVVAGVVDQDAGGTFINDGVELPFLGEGIIQAIVIKGEQAGIVIFEGGLGPGDDRFYLLVGVKIVIVVGDRILDETAAFFELFAIVGFLGGEDPVLKFGGFFQVIVHPKLPGCSQAEQR